MPVKKLERDQLKSVFLERAVIGFRQLQIYMFDVTREAFVFW